MRILLNLALALYLGLVWERSLSITVALKGKFLSGTVTGVAIREKL